MTDMVSHLTNCIAINSVTILDSESGKEITRPWTFACNGDAAIDQFLDNAGLGTDGTIDVRGVAMPWDFTLTYSDGTLIAEIYKFTWVVQTDEVTVQPMAMFRKLTRPVGGRILITLETYVVSDTTMLQRAAPYLSLLGSALRNIPSYDFNVTVAENQMAATA